jgi:hypothetical protein
MKSCCFLRYPLSFKPVLEQIAMGHRLEVASCL